MLGVERRKKAPITTEGWPPIFQVIAEVNVPPWNVLATCQQIWDAFIVGARIVSSVSLLVEITCVTSRKQLCLED